MHNGQGLAASEEATKRPLSVSGEEKPNAGSPKRYWHWALTNEPEEKGAAVRKKYFEAQIDTKNVFRTNPQPLKLKSHEN